MDALSLHLNFQIKTDPIQDECTWKKLLDAPQLCLQDVSESTAINKASHRMIVSSSKDGSHMVMHAYNHGLVTIDIQYVEPTSTHKSLEERYSYKFIKDLEENVTEIIGKSLCQYTRSVPAPLKRGRICPYFLRGNHTLFEYEPLELMIEKQSKWQNIKIYKTQSFGKILCLNDDIMLGESDIIYTNTLLGLERANLYKDKTIMILGGGDGGLLYELLKLSPRLVIMVEIDKDVIEVCREHLREICGSSLDKMDGPNYMILNENCLKTLQDYQVQKVKFDYVINDLSEYLIDTDTELAYDFKTSATILELSMQLLEINGKYLSRGNCITDKESLDSFERDVSLLGLQCNSFIAEVPSFMEKYCFFEVTRHSATLLVNGNC